MRTSNLCASLLLIIGLLALPAHAAWLEEEVETITPTLCCESLAEQVISINDVTVPEGGFVAVFGAGSVFIFDANGENIGLVGFVLNCDPRPVVIDDPVGAVPLPASGVLFGSALVFLVLRRKRKGDPTDV
jgi:hypothetical protein